MSAQATASHAYVPQKTALGAEMLAQREAGLSYTTRRVLLLADGQRNVGSLVGMLPGQNVIAELNELVARGLIEIHASADSAAAAAAATEAAAQNMPDAWMTASNFMMARARESLGVMAAGVINDLERVQDPEEARQAMSRWYRALRESRAGRPQADALRVQVSQMLRGSGIGTSSPTQG
ncbi:hypothetical protein [Viridibacterium curvum]|uniref:Uncharacterized protein n=1 Tax=Viridibacterium curvum TaxID=1101404 RepID=A0ABP9QSU7_9RHOO